MKWSFTCLAENELKRINKVLFLVNVSAPPMVNFLVSLHLLLLLFSDILTFAFKKKRLFRMMALETTPFSLASVVRHARI